MADVSNKVNLTATIDSIIQGTVSYTINISSKEDQKIHSGDTIEFQTENIDSVNGNLTLNDGTIIGYVTSKDEVKKSIGPMNNSIEEFNEEAVPGSNNVTVRIIFNSNLEKYDNFTATLNKRNYFSYTEVYPSKDIVAKFIKDGVTLSEKTYSIEEDNTATREVYQHRTSQAFTISRGVLSNSADVDYVYTVNSNLRKGSTFIISKGNSSTVLSEPLDKEIGKIHSLEGKAYGRVYNTSRVNNNGVVFQPKSTAKVKLVSFNENEIVYELVEDLDFQTNTIKLPSIVYKIKDPDSVTGDMTKITGLAVTAGGNLIGPSEQPSWDIDFLGINNDNTSGTGKVSVKKEKGSIIAMYRKFGDQSFIVGNNIITEGFVGESYNTEQKTFPGWRFVEHTGEPTSGTYKVGNHDVIYWYEQDSVKVTAKYVDEYESEISTSVIKNGASGTPYETSVKEIPGYEFVNTTGDKSVGNFGPKDKVVIYHYRFKKPTPPVTQPEPLPAEPPTPKKPTCNDCAGISTPCTCVDGCDDCHSCRPIEPKVEGSDAYRKEYKEWVEKLDKIQQDKKEGTLKKSYSQSLHIKNTVHSKITNIETNGLILGGTEADFKLAHSAPWGTGHSGYRQGDSGVQLKVGQQAIVTWEGFTSETNYNKIPIKKIQRVFTVKEASHGYVNIMMHNKASQGVNIHGGNYKVDVAPRWYDANGNRIQIERDKPALYAVSSLNSGGEGKEIEFVSDPRNYLLLEVNGSSVTLDQSGKKLSARKSNRAMNEGSRFDAGPWWGNDYWDKNGEGWSWYGAGAGLITNTDFSFSLGMEGNSAFSNWAWYILDSNVYVTDLPDKPIRDNPVCDNLRRKLCGIRDFGYLFANAEPCDLPLLLSKFAFYLWCFLKDIVNVLCALITYTNKLEDRIALLEVHDDARRE